MTRVKRVVLPGETIYYVDCELRPPRVPTIVRHAPKPSSAKKLRTRRAKRRSPAA